MDSPTTTLHRPTVPADDRLVEHVGDGNPTPGPPIAGGGPGPDSGGRAGSAAEAAGGFRARVWLYLAAATAVPLSLLALRVNLTGTRGHLSLPWDLFLGWVPVLLAVPFDRAFRRPESWARRLFVLLPLALGWLLFFPNAPYLLTEMIHLAPGDYPSTEPAPTRLRWLTGDGPFIASPPWLDLLLLTSVAACGALYTLAGLNSIHGAAARWAGRRTAAAVVLWLLALTSFGIAIGRFDRFNSWDVFAKPGEVAERLASHVLHPDRRRSVTACTLVLAVLLTVGYFGTREILRPAGRAGPPADS